MTLTLLFTLLLSILCGSVNAHAQTFQFQKLQFLNAAVTGVSALSPAGLILGYYVTIAGQQHYFFYNLRPAISAASSALVNKGGMITPVIPVVSHRYVSFDIPVPSPLFLGLTGVNDFGTVVGQINDNEVSHGFVWKAGKLQTIDFPHAIDTVPESINDEGTIVGYYIDSAPNGAQVVHSFIETSNGVINSFDYPEAKCDFENELAAPFAVSINNINGILGSTTCGSDRDGGVSILRLNNGTFKVISTGVNVFTSVNDRNDMIGTFVEGRPSGRLAVYINRVISNPNSGFGTFDFGVGIDDEDNIIGTYQGTTDGSFIGIPTGR